MTKTKGQLPSRDVLRCQLKCVGLGSVLGGDKFGVGASWIAKPQSGGSADRLRQRTGSAACRLRGSMGHERRIAPRIHVRDRVVHLAPRRAPESSESEPAR